MNAHAGRKRDVLGAVGKSAGRVMQRRAVDVHGVALLAEAAGPFVGKLVDAVAVEALVDDALCECEIHLDRRVAGYFEAHGSQLDVADIARIELPDHDGAMRLRTRATKDAIGFAALMQEAFVSGDTRVRCTFTSLRRRDGSSELEERLFAAVPGDVVGPFLVGSAHVLGCLLKLRPACFDADTQAVIEQILFEQWLAERRSQATVTWHWGRSPDAG